MNLTTKIYFLPFLPFGGGGEGEDEEEDLRDKACGSDVGSQ